MSTSTTLDVIAEIRAEMARQSVTQTDLAPRAHLSLPALRRRLSGESPLLVSELFDIAGALGVSPRRLLPAESVNGASSGV
jgi:transcriptional regulator with XRE-family HTH domain